MTPRHGSRESEHHERKGRQPRHTLPRDFASRVFVAAVIVAAVVGVILVLRLSMSVTLVFFASVLLAIFLGLATDCVQHLTRWQRRLSFAVAIVALLCLGTGAGWLLATPISAQVSHLSAQLPKVIQHDQELLRQYTLGRSVLDYLQNSDGVTSQTDKLLQKAPAVFSISLQGILDILVILFAGFYLALQPDFYVTGLLRLFPPRSRPRMRLGLDEIGWGLRRWLLGQIVSMTLMGILSWLGLLLLGVPGSGILGVLSGLLDFVAVFGTLAAAGAACVFALLKSPICALWVLCLYTGLHLFETNVVIPMIQRKATRVPPVLTVFSLMVFYTLFGFVGLLLAIPLLTFFMIAIRTLYVEQFLEHSPPRQTGNAFEPERARAEPSAHSTDASE